MVRWWSYSGCADCNFCHTQVATPAAPARFAENQAFYNILLFMNTEIVFQIWSTPGSTVELQRWSRLQLLTMRASGDASRTGTHVRGRVVCPSCVHSNGLRPFCREYVATEVKGLRTQREFAN